MDEIYESRQTTRRFVVAPRTASTVSINDSSEPKSAFWSIVVLVIRLTINCATSAECVIGLWIRRFIAMVLTAKYTVEVPFVRRNLQILDRFSIRRTDIRSYWQLLCSDTPNDPLSPEHVDISVPIYRSFFSCCPLKSVCEFFPRRQETAPERTRAAKCRRGKTLILDWFHWFLFSHHRWRMGAWIIVYSHIVANCELPP